MTRPGIFMGWIPKSGGRWGKAYHVLPLTSLCFQDFNIRAKNAVRANSFQGVQVIDWKPDSPTFKIEFPCCRKFYRANSTIPELERGIMLQRTSGIRRIPLRFKVMDPIKGELIEIGVEELDKADAAYQPISRWTEALWTDPHQL